MTAGLFFRRPLLQPSGMFIRDADERDLQAIADIYNDAVRRSSAIFSDDQVTAADRAEWLAGRRRGGFPTLVAQIEGETAGFGSYGPFRAFPGYRLTAEHSLYVAPGFARRGVGRALLAALIERARAAGLHVLVGAIESGNGASIALHAALGFEEVAHLREVGAKFGRWLDVTFMQMTLDARPAP